MVSLFTYTTYIITMGVGRGAVGAKAPPWILKFSAKKGCFISFEWEKTNFTTFGPTWKKSFRRPCYTYIRHIRPIYVKELR